MWHDNGLLARDIANYFSGYSREELESELFPKAPELYNAIAASRSIGITRAYREAMSKPVDNQLIFFESNLGKQYTGQPRYIYERLLERRPDMKFVWGYNGDPTHIKGNARVVERASDEYYWYLAQARYLVNNTTFPLWYHRDESFRHGMEHH